MAKSSISPILILDDERRWRGELREVLTEAGFECTPVADGEVAVQTVARDLGQKIKLVLADELLIEPDVPNGKRQHYQGSDVRKRIHAIRPDIQFIVISDLPRLASLEHQDPEQAAIAALAQRDQLSDGANVIAMFDKIGLASLNTSHDRYKVLIKKIRSVLGETKTNIKPALFIGLWIDRSKYEELATAAGIKNGDDFRLHKQCEKSGRDRRGIEVEKFLREHVFKKGIKTFLKVLAQESSVAKKPIRPLDDDLVKYISTHIRKPNSAKLYPASLGVGTDAFRVLCMLAYRSEKGDENPSMREEDYPYKPCKGQVVDLGMGVSEYSLSQSTDDAYDAIDNIDEGDRIYSDSNDLAQQQVAEEIAYEYDKSSGRRRQKARVSKPQPPLKGAIHAARRYLEKEKIGEIETQMAAPSDSDKLSAIYVAKFITGIILYPLDSETAPAIDLKDSPKTRLRKS
jgi:CheY-like chemotaxis protein